MKRLSVLRKSGVAAAIAALIVLGGATSASAEEVSGIGYKACPGGWGKLTAWQKGSGNSWAPGDYSAYPLRHGDTSYYRTIVDYQSPGSQGGSWRVATNGDYTTITPSCTNFG